MHGASPQDYVQMVDGGQLLRDFVLPETIDNVGVKSGWSGVSQAGVGYDSGAKTPGCGQMGNRFDRMPFGIDANDLGMGLYAGGQACRRGAGHRHHLVVGMGQRKSADAFPHDPLKGSLLVLSEGDIHQHRQAHLKIAHAVADDQDDIEAVVDRLPADIKDLRILRDPAQLGDVARGPDRPDRNRLRGVAGSAPGHQSLLHDGSVQHLMLSGLRAGKQRVVSHPVGLGGIRKCIAGGSSRVQG